MASSGRAPTRTGFSWALGEDQLVSSPDVHSGAGAHLGFAATSLKPTWAERGERRIKKRSEQIRVSGFIFPWRGGFDTPPYVDCVSEKKTVPPCAGSADGVFGKAKNTGFYGNCSQAGTEALFLGRLGKR